METLLNAWADDVVRLEARIADLQAERDDYYDMNSVLLDRLRALTAAHKAQTQRIAGLVKQLRAVSRGALGRRRVA